MSNVDFQFNLPVLVTPSWCANYKLLIVQEACQLRINGTVQSNTPTGAKYGTVRYNILCTDE